MTKRQLTNLILKIEKLGIKKQKLEDKAWAIRQQIEQAGLLNTDILLCSVSQYFQANNFLNAFKGLPCE